MKYVWIIVAVVILVRIDVVMRFFDKTAKKIDTQNSPEISSEAIGPQSELVPVTADLSIKSSPIKKFITMLEDFQATGDPAIQASAMDFLIANPTLFDDKLNKEFEGAVYKWRDLFLQKNRNSYSFMMGMMKHMRGENALMLRKVFSMVIDLDLPEFLNFYSKSSDENCLIMSDLAFPLPDEERYNELSDRLKTLNSFMGSDKFPPQLKTFADKCHLVLKLQVDKMRIAFENYDLQNPPPVLDEEGNPLPVAPVEPQVNQPLVPPPDATAAPLVNPPASVEPNQPPAVPGPSP